LKAYADHVDGYFLRENGDVSLEVFPGDSPYLRLFSGAGRERGAFQITGGRGTDLHQSHMLFSTNDQVDLSSTEAQVSLDKPPSAQPQMNPSDPFTKTTDMDSFTGDEHQGPRFVQRSVQTRWKFGRNGGSRA